MELVWYRAAHPQSRRGGSFRKKECSTLADVTHALRTSRQPESSGTEGKLLDVMLESELVVGYIPSR